LKIFAGTVSPPSIIGKAILATKRCGCGDGRLAGDASREAAH
jgi:hypothetical protein